MLMILLLACAPATAAAKCACSAGGGSSYNFLGDPSMDIDMDSYDEFVRSRTGEVSVRAAQTDEPGRLVLDLSDSSRVSLNLTVAQGEISGQGSLTQDNETTKVEVMGSLQGSKLDLELATVGGVHYRFSLAREGSIVLGDYSEIRADGRNLSGIAQGKWES